ncbi:MAG TPA: hypothetical protein H9987_04550 [Candidatus Luteococcus avicola]|nr:hypothetical protein [Candidatus Luteococcus avicola]
MADITPRDEHAKALKQATSMAKQLRTRVLSDPAKSDELVDQLNEATALRLVAHRWADAVAEAQEAVQAADRLVASRGPVGPYTPMVDAARYFSALGHVARLQTGMGFAQGGAQTAEVAYSWADQLTTPGLPAHLAPRDAVLTLLAVTAGLMQGGDVAAANAHADAAVARAREAGFVDDPQLVALLLDALAAQADARWAANLPADALAANREALDVWQRWTADDLQQLPRMTKPHLDRVATPLVTIQRDVAERLAAQGDVEGSLALREQMADLLHKMAARRSEQGRVDVALARGDQAEALLGAGRVQEAQVAAEAALEALQKLYKVEKPVGTYLPVQALVAPSIARAELAAGHADAAQRTIDGVFSRIAAHRAIDVPVASQARAQLVRHEVLSARGDQGAAAALAEFDRLAAEVRAAAPADADDRALVDARARGVVLRGAGDPPYWENLSDERSLAGSTRRVGPAVAAPVVDQVSDEELMRRIDEQREAEARERAVAELRAAAARSERERKESEERAARFAEVEARETAEREAREAQERQAQERVELEAAQEAALLEQERRRSEERAEQERRRAEERAEQERLARETAERVERERIAAEQAEAEQERLAAEQAERARVEAERVEQDRLDAEQGRVQAERAEQERLARETAERVEQERMDAEQAEAEKQRLAAEQAEQARVEAERAERERLAREAAELAERERLASEEAAREAAEAATDPVDDLRMSARMAGTKDAGILAHERLAEALEARAETDPSVRAETVQVLERLSDLQGWWAGRGTSKRAKQLAKQWGI